jgi:DNA polymerase-4
VIAHFDVDAFYASVAQRDDPSLRGKPIAIAWESRRSVLLTASYEARPYGVRSAMPLYKAKALCADLIVIPPNFELYRAASREIFAIIAEGASAIEGLSLDEAFAEVGPVSLDAAVAYAQRVRERVRANVGLTVSAGISTQKMVAKIASDEAKPDGLRAVEAGAEAAFLAPMPVSRLWGVGPKTFERLRQVGIATVGDLAALDDGALAALLGNLGRELRELARGNDDRAVVAERETRSVSSEQTFEFDRRSITELEEALRELADDVARRLHTAGLRGSTIGVKLKRSNFSIVQRQTATREPVDDAATIYTAALACLERAYSEGEGIRLLGIRVATLTPSAVVQTSLFA